MNDGASVRRSSPAPPAVAPWPFIGRHDALAAVCDAIRSGAPAVIITGDSGIGKTRLAREAIDLLRDEGVAAEWTFASAEARSISLGALAPLLRSRATSSVESPWDTMSGLQAELVRRHGQRPMVLAVDDAHRLDDISAALVVHLARSGQPPVVLTIRSGESLPPALSVLFDEDAIVRVDLTPLGETDIKSLVVDSLGGEVEASSLHSLSMRSGGNPLWLRELILDGLETGGLVEQGGRWSWQPSAADRRSSRLIDLLRARLSARSDEMSRRLELLALAEPLPLVMAQDAFGKTGVRDLLATGLVVEDDDATSIELRFSHPLFGEILRAATPALPTRDLWRELVALLPSHPSPSVIELRRQGAWYLGAELPMPPASAAAAAHDALRHSDPALTELLARTGLQTEGIWETEPGIAGDLSVARTEALSKLGRWNDVLEEMNSLMSVTLSGDQRARLAAVRLWPYIFQGDLAAADAFLADAASEAVTPDLADAASTHRASVALFAGDVDRCHAIAWELLGRPQLDDFSRRWSVRSVAAADALAGAADLAVKASEQELERNGVGPDFFLAPEELMIGYCLALWRSGSFDRALEVAEQFHRSSLRLADASLSAVTNMLVGISHLERGNLASSRRALTDAAATMERDQTLFHLPFAMAELARVLSISGDLEGASRALEAIARSALPPLPVFRSVVVRAQAWVTACRGDRDAGIDLLVNTARQIGNQGQLAQQGVFLHDVVRFGSPEVVTDELTRLAALCDGSLIDLYAAHARGLEQRNANGLTEVATSLNVIGDMVVAAEAWTEAGVLYAAQQHVAQSDLCRREASRLLAECGRPHTPALSRAVSEQRELTAREMQIATLASQGLSNHQIAEHAGCSVRTVENHLGRVYAKLGVNGRAAIAEALSGGR